ASPANATNTCGGTLTANAGGLSVQLSGGTIPASGSCSITVDLTAVSNVFFGNLIPSGGVTGNGGTAANGTAAAATLVVGNGVGVSKAFGQNDILPGQTSTLTISLTSNTLADIHSVAFTDTMPPGVLIAPAPN